MTVIRVAWYEDRGTVVHLVWGGGTAFKSTCSSVRAPRLVLVEDGYLQPMTWNDHPYGEPLASTWLGNITAVPPLPLCGHCARNWRRRVELEADHLAEIEALAQARAARAAQPQRGPW